MDKVYLFKISTVCLLLVIYAKPLTAPQPNENKSHSGKSSHELQLATKEIEDRLKDVKENIARTFETNAHVNVLAVIENIKSKRSGGFGTVYLSPADGNAFKVVSKKKFNSDLKKYCKALEVGLQEAKFLQIMKSKNVPYIVKMKTAFKAEDCGTIIIVLEYLTGTDLCKAHFESLNTEIGSPELVAENFARLAVAIGSLTSLGYVYRDLKLENVIRNDDGKYTIIDFGLVQKLQEKKSKGLAGTLYAMAPEMLCFQEYDAKVDVWSLGLLMWTIICHKNPNAHFGPFGDLNIDVIINDENCNVIYNLFHKKLTFPNAINLSKELETLIRAMLTVDPEKRASISDVISSPYFQQNGLAAKKIVNDFIASPFWTNLPKPIPLVDSNLGEHKLKRKKSQIFHVKPGSTTKRDFSNVVATRIIRRMKGQSDLQKNI